MSGASFRVCPKKCCQNTTRPKTLLYKCTARICEPNAVVYHLACSLSSAYSFFSTAALKQSPIDISGVDMKNCFSTKYVALAASLLMSSGMAFGHNAGEVGTATNGYLRDANNHPVKNATGDCWHVAAIAADPDCEVKP